MTLTCAFIEICAVDYLADHCNRPGEALVGVPVDGTTAAADMRDMLRFEADQQDALPADVATDVEIRRAIDSAVADVDADGLASLPVDYPDGVCDGSENVAWFRFAW